MVKIFRQIQTIIRAGNWSANVPSENNTISRIFPVKHTEALIGFPSISPFTLSAISSIAVRVLDLRMAHLEDITPQRRDAVGMLRERLFENLPAVRKLGFSDTFIRMWEFYLCYCEGSFLERYIGDVQAIYARPRNRNGGILAGV
jgi:cyclopropane-fatty-acyl-phospholipid synthase